jgi:predicted aspartyl protease
MFYLEVTNFEEDIGTKDESTLENPAPIISLHALTGIRSEGTMQLQVAIRGYALTTLLDTGSTHNFVSLKTTDGMRLTYSSNQGFQATVANGETRLTAIRLLTV